MPLPSNLASLASVVGDRVIFRPSSVGFIRSSNVVIDKAFKHDDIELQKYIYRKYILELKEQKIILKNCRSKFAYEIVISCDQEFHIL